MSLDPSRNNQLDQDFPSELGTTLLRDKRIQEKSQRIQNRLLKTKARLNSDGPRSNNSSPVLDAINIKNLAGEITEEELLQDKRRIEQPVISKDSDESEKSTDELLDEFEQRNYISTVDDLERELIEYDSNSLNSFKK